MGLTRESKAEIMKTISETVAETIQVYLTDSSFIGKIVEKVCEKIDMKFENISRKYDEVINSMKVDYGNKMDQMEQQIRSHNLIIHGIEEDGRKPEEKVIALMADKNVVIPPDFIEKCIRLGKSTGVNKPRPILITFCNYKYRNLVLDNKKLFTGSAIYINEDLTRKRYAVFKYAVSRFQSKNTWVINGNVKVRYNGKVHTVRVEEDCDSILEQVELQE